MISILLSRTRRARPVAVLLATAAVAVPSAQAQWAQAGYDAARTYANTTETTLSLDNVALLTPQWQRQLGQFYASAAIEADGRVLVCSNLHGITAHLPDTGERLWQRSRPGVGICGSPAVDGSGAYLASAGQVPDLNMVTALDPASGKVRWRSRLPHGPHFLGVNYDPVLQGDRVYVSTARDAVLALSAVDGRKLWQASTGGGVVLNTNPAVSTDTVFVPTWHECCDTESRKLFAFDAASGALRWKRNTDSSNMQHGPMLLGDQVLVGNDSGHVYAFRASDGKLRWSQQLTGYSSSPLVGQGNAVYAAGGNKIVHALDAATGDVTWTRALAAGSFITSNLAWANGLVYLVTQDQSNQHQLLALNARNGKVAAALPLSISGGFFKLTVADGRVLLSADGEVQALGL